MRNDEAYDAFDCEVCHECIRLGMAIVIFIVQQSNLVNYTGQILFNQSSNAQPSFHHY